MSLRKLTLAGSAAISVVLSACDPPPESPVALSESPTAEYDERLVGNWFFEEKRNVLTLQIKHQKPRTLAVVWVTVDGKRTQWIHATAFPSEIDGTIYYNIRRSEGVGMDYTAPGESPGYIFARPVFVGPNTLVVCFLHGTDWSDSKAKKLLEEHGISSREVKGEFKPGDKASYVIYATTEERLRELLRATPPAELFGAFIPYHRFGTPKSERDELERMGKARKENGCPFEWAGKLGRAPAGR